MKLVCPFSLRAYEEAYDVEFTKQDKFELSIGEIVFVNTPDGDILFVDYTEIESFKFHRDLMSTPAREVVNET